MNGKIFTFLIQYGKWHVKYNKNPELSSFSSLFNSDMDFMGFGGIQLHLLISLSFEEKSQCFDRSEASSKKGSHSL